MTTPEQETDPVRAAFEAAVWREWNGLDMELPSPVKTIARRLGLNPAAVAAVVYPGGRFGAWSDDDEPPLDDEPVRSLDGDEAVKWARVARHLARMEAAVETEGVACVVTFDVGRRRIHVWIGEHDDPSMPPAPGRDWLGGTL